MAETAHTPGPWFYRPHQYTDWGEVYAGQFRICQARDPLAMGHELLKLHRQAGTDPWEANARLIAAAPDLLEALVKIEPHLGRGYGPVEGETLGEIARSAISRATGEAP